MSADKGGDGQMELSGKRLSLMRQDARTALEQMADGEDAVSVAAQMYVRALPDKDMALGTVMAERIEEIVTDYERMKKNALEDPDGWIDRLLDAQGEGMNCVQRCRLLYELLRGVMAVNTGEVIGTGEFDEACASEALEAELRQRLSEALACSVLGEMQLEELARMLEDKQGEEIARRIVDFGRDEHDIKVVMAMIAYVQAQTGALEGAGADATIEDIVLGVCVAQDTQRIAQQVEDGECTEEEAARVIHLLGQILTLALGRTVEGAASLALGLAFPGMGRIARRIYGAVIGNSLSAVGEEAAGRWMDRALSRGWRAVNASDGRLARRLRSLCRRADRTMVSRAERTLEILRHPVRALLERVNRSVQQTQTVTA